MAYAIMRFGKRKGGAAAGIDKHHERKKDKYKSNPDIDKKRMADNYHIVKPQSNYSVEIKNRIEDAGCKVRKDSIKFVDTIITASSEFFQSHSQEDARKYFERATEFFKQEVGEENIFSAVVHMDECNPHMHLCFVPLTKDKRLSAKEIIGNRQRLVEWQDKFYDHMAQMFPELKRGEPAIETKRKHVPTWLFKQANRLTEEMTAICGEIENINNLNAGRQKDRILEKLSKWYPKINAFENQLKPYAETIKILNDNCDILRKESQRDGLRAQSAEQESTSLSLQLQDYKEFVDSIPDEIFEELKQRFEQLQTQGEGLALE